MNWVTFTTRMPSGCWEIQASPDGEVEARVTPLIEGRRHHKMPPAVARAVAAQLEAAAALAEARAEARKVEKT